MNNLRLNQKTSRKAKFFLDLIPLTPLKTTWKISFLYAQLLHQSDNNNEKIFIKLLKPVFMVLRALQRPYHLA